MIRMAQYGTKHGHAAGKLKAMLDNPEVEVVGLYEPDAERRRQVADDEPYRQVGFLDSEEELLGDSSIVAVASEGRNDESLDQTERIVQAGKHVWYDKPAGDDWAQWQRVVAEATGRRSASANGLYAALSSRLQPDRGVGAVGLFGQCLFGARPHVHQHYHSRARSNRRRAPRRHLLRFGRAHARSSGADFGAAGEGDDLPAQRHRNRARVSGQHARRF